MRKLIPETGEKEPRTWKEVVQATELELYTPSNKKCQNAFEICSYKPRMRPDQRRDEGFWMSHGF
ncbi:unnamed protein product [Prunus armeniaca]